MQITVAESAKLGIGYAVLIIEGLSEHPQSIALRLQRFGYSAGFLGLKGWQGPEIWLSPREAWYADGKLKMVLGDDFTGHIQPMTYELSVRGQGVPAGLKARFYWPDELPFLDGTVREQEINGVEVRPEGAGAGSGATTPYAQNAGAQNAGTQSAGAQPQTAQPQAPQPQTAAPSSAPTENAEVRKEPAQPVAPEQPPTQSTFPFSARTVSGAEAATRQTAADAPAGGPEAAFSSTKTTTTTTTTTVERTSETAPGASAASGDKPGVQGGTAQGGTAQGESAPPPPKKRKTLLFAGAAAAALLIGVVLSLGGGNKEPLIANDDAVTVAASSTTAINVLKNDVGKEIELTGVARVLGGGSAVLSPDRKTISYTSDAVGGNARLAYTITDAYAAAASASVQITVDAPPAPKENKPPIAGDDFATVLSGQSIDVAVLGNDHDPEGGRLKLSSVGKAVNGSTEARGDVVRYRSARDYAGPDVFTYVVADPEGGQTSGTVRVTVVAPTPPPPPAPTPPAPTPPPASKEQTAAAIRSEARQSRAAGDLAGAAALYEKAAELTGDAGDLVAAADALNPFYSETRRSFDCRRAAALYRKAQDKGHPRAQDYQRRMQDWAERTAAEGDPVAVRCRSDLASSPIGR